MNATKEELRLWIEYGRERKATHLIIVRNLFEGVEFPIYVLSNESIEAKVQEFNSGGWLRVEEVFSFKHKIEDQLETLCQSL